MEDLLEADISLVFLTNQGVDLVHWDLALHIGLDLRLYVLVVDV